jgi:DNA-binding transcriptional MerR regulator
VRERRISEHGPYNLQDLLPLLRIKPHVLRYWEQTLPLVRAGRDDAGHRVWSAGQVRMLMRIRHLVVDRGVSVPAAGESLLREAEGSGAHLKAGLERVRNTLVVLLMKAYAADSGRPPPIVDRELKTFPLPSSAKALPIENLIDQQLIPPPTAKEPPEDLLRSMRYIAFRPDRGPAATSGVRLVYSHLFARGDQERIASTLADLVRFRLECEDPKEAEGPLVVAAPTGWEDTYRDALPPETEILAVPQVVYGSLRYSAPTLALLMTLAVNGNLDRRLRSWGRSNLYIWAADNPNSPVNDPLADYAREATSGLALGVQRYSGGLRLTESVSLHLPVWRRSFEATVRCGRWRIADRESRRCFVVWLRDLVRLNPPVVSAGGAVLPTVWRGSSWFDQVKLVWPRITV